MQKFGRGQPVARLEDRRFLTGGGRYVDDIAPADALHAVIRRAELAHAEIVGIDASEAEAMPGVRVVLTAETLAPELADPGIWAATLKNSDGSPAATPLRPPLAQGRVRFVGEPVAVVVAETQAQAKAAAETIEIDYGELEPHLGLAPGGPALYDEAPDNVAFDWGFGDAEATEAAFAGAARVVTGRIENNRIICASMEPRGCFAEWDEDRLHLCFGGQGVWHMKGELSRMLGLDEGLIRITNPDVGGGFGMKGQSYPEYFVIPVAAKLAGRPVRWMSDRGEAMLSDNAGRDLVSDCALAFDAQNRIVGYKVDTLCNLGACNSQFGQLIQTNLFARVLTGPYAIPVAALRVRGIYTNTTQVDAYRGAGRPEAIYALERMMDYAARELGVDPWELRQRNFIPPAAFPYRSVAGETYDVGDFPRVLARGREAADVAGFDARRATSEAAGKLRGLGLCYYIEAILGSPEEGAKVEFHEDGTVSLYVGTQSNGQGHETVYATFLSDQTGIPVEQIRIVQGDSDLIAKGGGTGGSRSVTVQTNVTLTAVAQMVEAFGAFLAEQTGADPAQIRFDEDRFRLPGTNETFTFLEAAERARAAGRADLLVTETRATLPGRSYPNGAHVAEVEIDPETGVLTLERYTVADDFGNLINPMLAEGQVHGGVAQGIGQAVTERVVFDETGQLLTASFMDYGMPRADDLPMIEFHSEPVPSTANPMGMKGCGEAGTVGALAAIANAVQDALAPLGIERVDMPFTPARLWHAIHEARPKAAAE